jgi:hypothetical protein
VAPLHIVKPFDGVLGRGIASLSSFLYQLFQLKVVQLCAYDIDISPDVVGNGILLHDTGDSALLTKQCYHKMSKMARRHFQLLVQ